MAGDQGKHKAGALSVSALLLFEAMRKIAENSCKNRKIKNKESRMYFL